MGEIGGAWLVTGYVEPATRNISTFSAGRIENAGLRRVGDSEAEEGAGVGGRVVDIGATDKAIRNPVSGGVGGKPSGGPSISAKVGVGLREHGKFGVVRSNQGGQGQGVVGSGQLRKDAEVIGVGAATQGILHQSWDTVAIGIAVGGLPTKEGVEGRAADGVGLGYTSGRKVVVVACLGCRDDGRNLQP